MKAWTETARNELMALNLTYKIALNRTEWKSKIYVGDLS